MLNQTPPIIIITLSILFSIILLSQKKSRARANIFLSLFLVAVTVQFFFIFLINIESISNNWIKYNTVFGFFYGPSIYYYVNYLINNNYKMLAKDFIHFTTPFIVLFSLNFVPYSSQILPLLMYLSLIIYAIVSSKLIGNFGRLLKSGRWKKPNKTLEWLKYFLALFISLILFDLIDQTLFYFSYPFGVSIVHVGLIILISWMFYRAFNQPELFKTSASIVLKAKEDYQDNDGFNCINTSDVLSIKDRLEINLSQHEWYLLPNLTLEDLANKLNTTPQLLSSTINSNYNLNFSSYINTLRIEHAKKMLKTNSKQQKSISEIMYDSGFSSKSRFNTIFRNHTGITPSQFRKIERQ